MRIHMLKIGLLFCTLFAGILSVEAAGIKVKITQIGNGATTVYNIVNGNQTRRIR